MKKIFDKEVSRRDFLKMILPAAALIGSLGFLKLNNNNKEKSDTGFGKGAYGR